MGGVFPRYCCLTLSLFPFHHSMGRVTATLVHPEDTSQARIASLPPVEGLSQHPLTSTAGTVLAHRGPTAQVVMRSTSESTSC